MSGMEPEAFLEWIVPKAQLLKKKYHLDSWNINIRVVADEELSPKNAAEVSIREEYRGATILVAESLVRSADKEVLLSVVDHELQHVFLHPLDALKSLVMDAIPDSLRAVVNNEFGRTNERIRASVERLIVESQVPS